MAQQSEPPVTQRAYTLRLNRFPGDCPSCKKADCACWRESLWAIHEAVNKGAKAFGDWLLTLRGGLCYTLAEVPAVGEEQLKAARKVLEKELKDKKDENGNPRKPTDDEVRHRAEADRKARIRDRRILLALSWLSVESAPKKGDAHEKFVVASGRDDTRSSRDEKIVGKLREILEKRGVKDAALDGWIKDCEPSLSAAIRDDAVWVNRSGAFDVAQQRVESSLKREEVWDLLGPIFGSRKAYLAPLKAAEDSDAETADEDKAKDLVQKAGQWLSSRFGTGKGADFGNMEKVYHVIATTASNDGWPA